MATNKFGIDIDGETAIDWMDSLSAKLWFNPNISATPEALEVNNKAELNHLDLGGFFTSLMLVLLVKKLSPASRQCLSILSADKKPC